MSEITSIELEALIFTYGEAALTVSQQNPLSIAISIPPHTGEVETEQYVNATLFVATSPGYPGEAPALKLQNPQGRHSTACSAGANAHPTRCFSSQTHLLQA